ncbi:MAG: asparagine synthase (glutamine-hydrolyzing) [Phycisphaerae bacterium]|nr:asparagine synthase (glutamine-hydrolyzing) [Phycisphaerae bacterium]
MCGIAGIIGLQSSLPPNAMETTGRMLSVLRHRGPDESGLYVDSTAALGQVRLSIIDLAGGHQPIHNEDQSKWIVFNGEIFNYRELREDLILRGHRFQTQTDTEVIVHLYEQYGPDCVQHLNGQFAFVIWDSRRRIAFMARDRVGIRPLHYTIHQGRLIFASEIKSILTDGSVPRRPDPIALDQIFTFWAPLTPRTAFEGISELPPGHTLTCRPGQSPEIRRYWQIPLCEPQNCMTGSVEDLCEQMRDLLTDAVRLRLRADVPVGTYLSGGLDSSILTSMVVKQFNNRVRTFGLRFEESEFDETPYQSQMVAALQCHHSEILVSNDKIGSRFQEAIWHIEKPMLRTSPIPLMFLSGLVHDQGFKVVLSGEGADEVFGGYNIFREAKIRRYWAKSPGSSRRASLIGRLYPYIFTDTRSRQTVQSFFTRGLGEVDNPLYSHLLRWDNTRRLRQFFSDDLLSQIGSYDPYADLTSQLPDTFYHTHDLSKAQYLEMTVFMSQYLLSSQGDRMAMAGSVETRVPYLDHRVVEFMARVSPRHKIAGLREKALLKRTFAHLLPQNICRRNKHPFRAPIKQGLLNDTHRGFVRDMLTGSGLADAGLFNPQKVTRLLDRMESRLHASETDSMALAGLLSTQSVYQQFMTRPLDCPDMEAGVSQVTDKRRGMPTTTA